MKDNFTLPVDSPTVAAFFDVSIRAVQHWSASGCPKLGRGRYDLKAVHQWWWENIGADRAAAESGDESLQEQRRLYWAAKAERERLAADREKGDLMPVEEIKVQWVARMSEVANGLQQLAMRLPPLISGKDHRQVRDIVKLNVWQILDNFSRNGRFCYPDKPKAVKKAKNAKKTVKKRKLVAV